LRREKHENVTNPFWISIGDLMSGLLMLFILITATVFYYLGNVQRTRLEAFTVLEKRLKKAGLQDKIKAEKGSLVLADEILFEYDKAVLDSEGQKLLGNAIPLIADVFIGNSTVFKGLVSINIEAYASEFGYMDKKQMYLTLERAKTVWEFIYDLPTFPSRLKDPFLKKLQVTGLGNMRAKSWKDYPQDRKVVFRFHFRNTMEEIFSLSGILNSKTLE